MDPLSITAATASLIRFVSSTSITLYTFVNQTRNVDQNVKDLVTEINALQRTLLQIDSVLQEPRINSIEENISTDDSEQLWTTVNACLEECRTTIMRLDSALDGVYNKESNWAMQTFRQVKLNLRKDDIDTLRNQIHTHFISLSTALQMVNIRITYLAPVIVTADLGPRIDMLQKSLDLLTIPLEDLRTNASHTSATLVQAKSENLEKLHSLGKRMLAKATTVYGSSAGDRSVCGERITRESVLRTMTWIPDPLATERPLSMSSITLSHKQRPSSSAIDSGIDMLATTSDTFLSENDVIDSDGEAEFEFEITERLLKKGQEAFASGNYQEAVNYLRKGITNFNRLPQRLRTQLDVAEIPLIIATCKYYLDEIDEASNDLMALIRQESMNDQDAIRKCQISYLLSQICLIRNDVEAAESHCRNSLKGRRRLLGKDHQDYIASLALLSEIFRICGKREEAAVYKDLVPSELYRTAEMVRMKSLIDNRRSPQTPNEIASMSPSSSTMSPPQVPTPISMEQIDPEGTDPELNSRLLKGHTGRVFSLAFSPDGALLASVSRDKSIRIWDVKTGDEVQKINAAVPTSWFQAENVILAFSPDGTTIASSLKDKSVRLWNVRTGREVRKLEGYTGCSPGVMFSSDGKVLISASDDKIVRIWDVNTGRAVRELKGHSRIVNGVALSSDGRLLASASDDKTVRLWDTRTSQELRKLEGHTDSVKAVALSSDGRFLASASRDITMRLWDMKNGREIRRLEGHFGIANALEFSPDSQILASASGDRTVRIWDVKTGRATQKLEELTDWVRAVAFFPDGSILALASYDSHDSTIRLWKVKKTWYQ